MRLFMMLALVGLTGCVAVNVRQVREQVPQTITESAGSAALGLSEINAARTGAGLAPLARDAALERAAVAHAKDMTAKGYFEHTAPDGSTPRARLLAAGDCGLLTGENLAKGQKDMARVTADWMASPGHRANILNARFTRGGLVQVGDIYVMTFSGSC